MTQQSKIRALKSKAQRGFSNVQIAIGILVGVIVLLGSLSGYQYISQAKVNNEITTLGDLKSATVRYGQFAGLFTATNVTAAILNGQNFFNTAGLVVTGAAAAPVITNQWGGAVTVGVGTANLLGDAIAFTFTNVPGDACRQLGTRVDNVASVVSINNVDTKAAGAQTNVGTVTTQCAAGGDANTIIYTITR
jgi:hypothetical protein